MESVEKEVALGTKVFSRVDDLRRLLDSIPQWISTVYIADDGETSSEKEAVYTDDYHFDLEVLKLEYDAGLGAGRDTIVANLSEEYLIIVDPDHQIPPTAKLLYDQLCERPELGGVGGLIVEPNTNRLYSQALDFDERWTSEGTLLVRSPYAKSDAKEIEVVAGAPLVRFDFVPNAAIFRRECLKEQSWDPNYIIGHEHTDFYVSHWKNTTWEFAISPSVQFLHYPGGNTEYSLNRHDPKKNSEAKEYLLHKWGYVDINTEGGRWIEAGPEPSLEKNVESAVEILHEEGLFNLLRQIRLFVRNKLK